MSSRRRELCPALYRAIRLFIAGSSLFSQSVAEKLGLHPTDMQFLNLLDLLGAMTPGALSRCSGLSTGGVTVVLDRLEKAGYIRRSGNPSDRRSLLVGLVPTRQRQVTAHYASAQKQFEATLASFSDRDLEVVLRFLTSSGEMRPSGFEGPSGSP